MLKKRKILFFCFCLIMAFSVISNLYAEEWSIYGPRALGMGGAGVAVEDPATAFYWNPAQIILAEKKTGIQLNAQATVSAEGDVLQKIDDISDYLNSIGWTTISSKIDNGTPLTTTEAQNLLELFAGKLPQLDETGEGLLAQAYGGITINAFNIGFGGNLHGFYGIDPVISFEDLSLNASGIANFIPAGTPTATIDAGTPEAQVYQTLQDFGLTATEAAQLIYLTESALGGGNVTLGEAILNNDPNVQQALESIGNYTNNASTSTATTNDSGAVIKGCRITEIGATYGYSFIGKLAIGLKLKIMEGETYYHFIRYSDIESGGDLADDIKDKKNTKTSTAFSVDAGILFTPIHQLRIGISARDLTSPEFDWNNPFAKKYKLDPKIRAGVAFSPINNLTIAADMDLTENESNALKGYKSKMIAAGLEYYVLGFLAIRGGIYKNTSSGMSNKPVYTLGIGLKLLFLDFDIAGAMSTEKIEIESGTDKEEIRARYAVTGGLKFQF